jgi:tRNA G46 methylase TrmB
MIEEARSMRPFRAERLRPPPALGEFLDVWQKREPLNAPVDLEIGSGVGWHAIQQVQFAPDRFLIAVEKTREKFEKMTARIERNRAKSGRNLSQLFPVHADAVAFAVHAVAEASVDRIFLYYPNPCSKNPAARWLRMPFFGFLLSRLRNGGTIALRTNLRSYFEESIELAETFWGLEVISRREFTREEVPPANAMTHFERKYLERGETCFEWIGRK